LAGNETQEVKGQAVKIFQIMFQELTDRLTKVFLKKIQSRVARFLFAQPTKAGKNTKMTTK
jgi:hypothetical protein